MSVADVILPELIISKELIERIQFSVSSRNAESKLGECAVHVFAAQYSDNPNNIKWQYVSSGVACLLRNRELTKNGRKYMWSMSLCLYNASYGVLVWKAKLLPNSEYTAVADNFHVFALGEVDVLVGLLYSSKERACEIHTTYIKWHQERMRDDGKKGGPLAGGGGGATGAQGVAEPVRFRKEMISKPCNFQHIQGTQAIDECMDIEKIKADIIAAFFGLGTKAGRSETDGDAQPQHKSKKKKKEPPKQRLEFKEILVPQTATPASPSSPSSSSSLPAATTSPVSPLPLGGSALPPPGGLPPSTAYASEPQHLVHQDSQQALPPGPAVSQYPPPPQAPTNGYQEGSLQDTPHPPPNPLFQQTSSTSLGGRYEAGFEPNGYPAGTSSSYTAGGGGAVQSRRDMGEVPNYQNPASPAFQEYGNSSQDSYPYNITSPVRLDMNLEKEFAESALFQPPVMTAN